MDEDGFTIVAKGSKRCAHGNRGAFRNPSELADLGCESWTSHSRACCPAAGDWPAPSRPLPDPGPAPFVPLRLGMLNRARLCPDLPATGKGPRYSPSSSAALGALDVSLDDAKNEVARAIEVLDGSDWLAAVLALVREHASDLVALRRSPCPATGCSNPAGEGPHEAGSENHSQASAAHHATSDGVVEEIVCYGVGHFSVSRASALQAALAVLLRRHLRIRGAMHLYDPVLSDNEKAAAAALGFSMLPVNEVGLRAVSMHTLFFMPHCGRRLYSNVLRANWGAQGLGNLLIVGNSFQSYRLRMLTDDRAKRSCCIERLGDGPCRESRLPPAEVSARL